jgi:multiple sugar transport system ATP-binding protein
MSNLKLENVTKEYPGVTALKDITFDVQDGEFFVLLGPTGAGKTTTLRVVAGLTKQDQGSVLFDDQAVDDFPPAERDVALVFQQYSLYPTMSVYDNLAFPLRSPMRKLPEDEIRAKVEYAAKTLRIEHLVDRKTAHLSGGEMQRVSIGRAIVREPRIFLMDEPLSNLDFKLREALRVELQHLQKTQGSTTLFVTHDQIEALTMADRIAVLDHGHIIQIGNPEDIYDRPATTFVAQLVGTPRINLVKSRREDGTLKIEKSDLHLPTPPDCEIPEEVLLGIRPEDVNINPGGKFTGQVTLTEPLGVETVVYIRSKDQMLVSLVPGLMEFSIGDELHFDILHDRLHCFDLEGNRVQVQ